MNFWDDKKEEIVKNCLGCNSFFDNKKGVACPFSCLAQQLANEHQRLIEGMLKHCLPRKNIIFTYKPKTILIKEKEGVEWGWTNDIKKEICLHWYTLRSKKRFLDTLAHEIGHIMAYEEKFLSSERKVIERYFLLVDQQQKFFKKYIFDEFLEVTREIKEILAKKPKIIAKYKGWEGHDYQPWYKQYEKFHQKLLASHFSKYAYGNFEPVPYNLIVKRKGDRKKTISI